MQSSNKIREFFFTMNISQIKHTEQDFNPSDLGNIWKLPSIFKYCKHIGKMMNTYKFKSSP